MYDAILARAFSFLLAYLMNSEICLSKVSLQSNLIPEIFSSSRLRKQKFSILILAFCVAVTKR